MKSKWYYSRQDGTKRGPVSSAELRRLVELAELSPQDLVWKAGMSEWTTATSVGLFGKVGRTPPPLPPPPGPSPTAVAPVSFPIGMAAPTPVPPPVPPPVTAPPEAPPASEIAAPVVPKQNARAARHRARRDTTSTNLVVVGGTIGGLLLIGGIVAAYALQQSSAAPGPSRASAPATNAVSTQSDVSPTAASQPLANQTGLSAAAPSPPEEQTDPEAELPMADEVEDNAAPLPDFDAIDVGAAGKPANGENAIDEVAKPKRPRRDLGARNSAALFPSAGKPADPMDSSLDKPAEKPAAKLGQGPAAKPTASTNKSEPADNPPSPAKVPSQPAAGSKPPMRAKSNKPQVLYQEIEIEKKPTYSVQGIQIPQHLHYRIVSRLDAYPPAEDGSIKVVQYVEDTELLQADELSRATFVKSLGNLRNQQYTYKLDRSRQVTELAGHKKNAVALPVKAALGEGFLLTSVIDLDGWKELAQLTFFQPQTDTPVGEPYKRQMTHDWEPLGSWYGTTTFTANAAASADDLQRVDYVHELDYVPPQAKGGGMLPFQIAKAEFKNDVASGTILYDARQRRVQEVQEQFQVTGTVSTVVLGQPSEIELQEVQKMTIRITDQRPVRKP